jgi:hypothetical protein
METRQSYATLDFQYSMIESSVYLRLLDFYKVVNILTRISQQPSSPHSERAVSLLSAVRGIEKRLRRFGYSLDGEKVTSHMLESTSSSRVDSLHRFVAPELGLCCTTSDWLSGHLLMKRDTGVCMLTANSTQ